MRVLLYAPVDLNLIDGSAIWCASVAQMLVLDPDIAVDVLLNSPLRRTVNTDPLAGNARVRWVSAWEPQAHAALRELPERLGPRLTPAQALAAIERLHAAEPYDLLILRGGSICRLVAAAPRLAGRSWFYLTQGGADFETIDAIARSNGRIACQTPLLQEYLEGLLGTAPERYVPLPPMVPRLLCAAPRTAGAGRTLGYIGKFDPDYRVEEQIAALAAIRRQLPDAQLVVAGDKFHDVAGDGAFERRLAAALKNTAGVVWRGGLTRDAVGQLLLECDLGSCWRTAAYDDSLEMSTKALEYAAAGLPVLLNPARINRLVFGEDYPLYVDSPASFEQRVIAALTDDAVYRRAAGIAFETSRRFTFAAVNAALQPHLAAYRPAPAVRVLPRPHRLLFAGHDLKFCRPIISHFEHRPDCLVRIDPWSGHTVHFERRSEELLRWADVIWCEWCLGNAVWYSARVRPGQRLLVRVHRQEITTAHPQGVTWPQVHDLVFIAAHVRDALAAQLAGTALPRAHLICNTFDCAVFAREKDHAAERRLGLLGYCPKLKNPRLAAEILDELRADDERWRLVLVGHPPQHYTWLWERPDERAYYESFDEYARSCGRDRHIVRQEWTDDAPAWYATVGFILSTSDFEGSHQAIPEGMAAGCVPVVRRWAGAAELYPNALLFDTAEQAAQLIRELSADPAAFAALSARAQAEARERFDLRVVMPQIESLILPQPAPDDRPAHRTGAPGAPVHTVAT